MAVTQSLSLTESDVKTLNNTSKVRILWQSTQTGESWNGYARTAKYYVSINDGAEKEYSVGYTLPQNATATIVDTTLTITSRIGKLPINIPAGVTVTYQDNVVSVKGPKGELSQAIDPSINVSIADNVITFSINEASDVEQKQKQAFYGLYRALVNNMVIGVSEGYKKEMELVGVGYRVQNTGNLIEFNLGYTHAIFIQLPKEIKVETKDT